MDQKTNTVASILFMVTGMATVGVIDNFITYIAVEVSLWQFHFLRSISHDLNQHLELIFLYYYLFLVDVYNPYVTSFI